MSTTDPAGAEARLFPTAITPTSADTIALYSFHTGRLAHSGYAAALAALHARSIETHGEFAALLRSPEALEDVGIAAMHMAASYGRQQQQDLEAAAARESYRRLIAQQLAERTGHELAKAAKAFLSACAARDRAEAERLAAIEAERVAAEQAAAEARAAKLAQRAKLASEARAAAAGIETVGWQAEQERRSATAKLADAVIARLRAAELSDLRIGRALYGVEDLILTAHGHSPEMLLAISGALDLHEEKSA